MDRIGSKGSEVLKIFGAGCGLILGVALVLAGVWLPVHFRSVAPEVLQAAVGGQTLAETADRMLLRGRVGPAGQVIQAMGHLGLETSVLEGRRSEMLEANPEYRLSGGPSPFFEAFRQSLPADLAGSGSQAGQDVPVTRLLASGAARAQLGNFLESSGQPTVRNILATRNLVGWQRLFPVEGPGGAALDLASLVTGLLVQSGAWSENALLELESLVSKALQEDRQALRQLELLYLSVLPPASRYNWLTLETWVRAAPRLPSLEHITPVLQGSESTAVIYAAVVLSQDPGGVAAYLSTFPDDGLADLETALRTGSEALLLLLEDRQAITPRRPWADWLPAVPPPVATAILHHPNLARFGLMLVWVLGGILLAVAGKSLFSSGAEVGRGGLIGAFQDMVLAVCLLLVLIVLSEPNLLSQSVTEPGKLLLEFELQPQSAAGAASDPMDISAIDQITLLVLLLFLVIQLSLYMGSLIKLVQIRRSPTPPGVKLKLLENEEHLFDAGLYVGLSGTVIALVMLAMGVVQASLVAAYASTLFGIIFVALFKIFHLRPLRRRYILDAERY